MMYRLLKDLIDWKCNVYLKCRLGNFRFTTVLVFILVIKIAQCSTLSDSDDLSRKYSESDRSQLGRAAFEHGLFRHDKPRDSVTSPFPSDTNGPVNDGIHQAPCLDTHGCHSDRPIVATIPPVDNRDRDRYTYDRFKRSVTTLNFHPKPQNESRNVVLKPLRIFKYVTEDDILLRPPSSSRRSFTIFHSLDSSATEKSGNDNDKNNQRIIGGAKVNLKAKFNKSGSGNNTNSTTTSNQVINNEAKAESDIESKRKKVSASPKPENILIFKPSLAVRKSNKTSLIPSGNHPQSSLNGKTQTLGSSIAPKESTDPNSSTVNDRSLMQNLFDSVVMLNEEGQKQLFHQQHQSVESHREKTSNNTTYSDDNEISMSAIPSSSQPNGNATINIKSSIISPSLPIANNTPIADAGFTFTSMASDLVEEFVHSINQTITNENKDSVSIQNSKGSLEESGNTKSKKSKSLDEDDSGEDGSERSRRSPFKMSNKFQPNAQPYNQGSPTSNGGQLARAALFRTTVSRMRPTPTKVMPRIISPIPSMIPRKLAVARTILPMKQMTLKRIPVKAVPMQQFQAMPKMTVFPGPIPPGPVGPPIAAIKVTDINAFNANINNNNNMMMQQVPMAKEMLPDASRTVYSYKALPDDVLLNQESSYYSPTYKRFKKRFQTKLSSIMDTERDLDDIIQRWDAEPSRFPSRSVSHPKSRSRSSQRQRHHRDRHHDRDRHDRLDRERHERERHDRERQDRDRDRQDREDRDRLDRDRQDRDRHDRDRQDRERQDRDRQDRDRHDRHDRRRDPVSHHRNSPRGKKIPSPKYQYPKNAENIQDILKYFDKDGNRQGFFDKGNRPGLGSSIPIAKTGAVNPNRQQSSFPEKFSHPKLADLSGEFRDVHASLLKDIREFAKRPNLFGSSSSKASYPRSPFDSFEGNGNNDPIDDIFGDKPKPVRDLIKPDLYSLENIRERIAFNRGKLHGKYRDKDHQKNKNLNEHDKDIGQQFDDDEEGFFDTQRRQNGEDPQSSEKQLFSKEEFESPVFTKGDKDDSHTIFPSSHYNREKDSQKENSSPFEYHSSEFIKPPKSFQSTKPIVLKRPKNSFRVREGEIKKLAHANQDFVWNSFTNEFEKVASPPTYDSPLVLKSPSPTLLHSFPYNTYGTPTAAQALGKPVSVEDEDIVEIHTGGPGGAASGVPAYQGGVQQGAHAYHHGGIKQDKLQKMYMDVLQQKMQLEAALLRPQSTLQSPSTMPHHHHTQHSPMQIPRVPPHISVYPTSAGNLAPMAAGYTGMRRKKPMRMKIHIYPNGNDGLEQGIEAANLLAGNFGTSGFSASNPPGVVAPPPKDSSPKASESAIPSGPGPMHMPPSPTGFGGPPPGLPPGQLVPLQGKNKNVVLHLHVHRRNDVMGPLELEAEGSSSHPVTMKPLTYKEIYDEQMKKSEEDRNMDDDHDQRRHHHNHNSHQNHREEEGPLSSRQDSSSAREQEPHEDETERERDKLVSMEVPIHDEKIEDVLHSIMKQRNNRNKADNRKKRS